MSQLTHQKSFWSMFGVILWKIDVMNYHYESYGLVLKTLPVRPSHQRCVPSRWKLYLLCLQLQSDGSGEGSAQNEEKQPPPLPITLIIETPNANFQIDPTTSTFSSHHSSDWPQMAETSPRDPLNLFCLTCMPCLSCSFLRPWCQIVRSIVYLSVPEEDHVMWIRKS